VREPIELSLGLVSEVGQWMGALDVPKGKGRFLEGSFPLVFMAYF